MSLLNKYVRVSKKQRCLICGKPDWCLVSRDGTHAVCAREESSKRMGDAGWRHELTDPVPIVSSLSPKAIPKPAPDLGHLADKYSRGATSIRVAKFASELGLKALSLRRMRIGWDGFSHTFPMSDETGKVIGIRRRLPDGTKLSVKGGHEGCFVPDGIFGDQTEFVLVCEGPTDTAASLDAGFPAIGRPSCNGGREIICKLLKGMEAVIVSDDDGPGRAGAEKLAEDLIEHRIACRIILPRDGKDLRAWHPTYHQLSVVVACAKYWTAKGSKPCPRPK